ncbi:MAG: hypothetical protein ACQETQ_03065 [Spirochaetota bacterium]
MEFHDEVVLEATGIGEGITDCLFWLIADYVHCTVDYSKNIDLTGTVRRA